MSHFFPSGLNGRYFTRDYTRLEYSSGATQEHAAMVVIFNRVLLQRLISPLRAERARSLPPFLSCRRPYGCPTQRWEWSEGRRLTSRIIKTGSLIFIT